MGETKTNTFWRSIVSARYSRLVGFVAAMCFFVIFGFALVPVCDKPEDTFAAPVPSTTTLSMTTPSVSLSLALENGAETFAVSDPASFSVTTNNYTGYELSIRAEVDDANSTKLVNGNYALNSITAATADGTGFDAGDWGYRPSKIDSMDNTNFLPAPTYAGSVINITNAANAATDTYSLALAAKADYNNAIGEYSNTFVITATGNPVNYTITYDKNTTDDVSNMPNTQSGTLSNSDVLIASNIPIRDEYEFSGWCDGAISIVDGEESCDANTYAPEAVYSTSMLSTNSLALKAIWKIPIPAAGTVDGAFYAADKQTVTVSGKKYYKMQDMTTNICSGINSGEVGKLVDTRDNTIYNVGKLADSKCWLLDNLALDLSNATVKDLLTSTTTNADDSTLNYLKNGGGASNDRYPIDAITANWTSSYSYSQPRISLGSKNVVPQNNNDPLKAETLAGNWKVGVYYNLCAASAGYFCFGRGTTSGSPSGSPTMDICPYGWRLPTGGSSGEYNSLHSVYNSNYTNFRKALHLPLSGSYTNGSASEQGTKGYYWASGTVSGASMYNLTISTSAASPRSSRNRYYGQSVRCVAK